MKKIILPFMALALATFFACSDDSSSVVINLDEFDEAAGEVSGDTLVHIENIGVKTLCKSASDTTAKILVYYKMDYEEITRIDLPSTEAGFEKTCEEAKKNAKDEQTVTCESDTVKIESTVTLDSANVKALHEYLKKECYQRKKAETKPEEDVSTDEESKLEEGSEEETKEDSKDETEEN